MLLIAATIIVALVYVISQTVHFDPPTEYTCVRRNGEYYAHCEPVVTNDAGPALIVN